MLELREDGAGVEDTTKEMVSTLLASKAKARAQANQIVTSADRRGLFPESTPTNREAQTRAVESKGNATLAVKRAIPQGSARKAKTETNRKEKETHTKGKAKDRGVGAEACGK